MECVFGVFVILLVTLCVIGAILATIGTVIFVGGMVKELQTIDVPWPSPDKWLDQCWETGKRLGRWVVRRVRG